MGGIKGRAGGRPSCSRGCSKCWSKEHQERNKCYCLASPGAGGFACFPVGEAVELALALSDLISFGFHLC